jgi:hypothetical protein
MQNKPNFLNTPMNITFCLTKHYKQKTPRHSPAKQTQFKPNQSQTNPILPLFLAKKLASFTTNQPQVSKNLRAFYAILQKNTNFSITSYSLLNLSPTLSAVFPQKNMKISTK